MKHNPIIVALDVENAAEARALVERIGPAVDFYKVGLELYAEAGMPFVRELIAGGKQVFLDLKLHDIGETVKRATANIARVEGIRFLTVHALGQVMRAAVEGRGASGLQLLGVTVLTSLDANDLAEDGYALSVAELAAKRAANAKQAGVDGLVCSPHEVANVRRIVGPGMKLITPGVRSAGAATGDQKRVATPSEAIANGADYLVIGRQITRSADPAAEAARILGELAA